MNYSSAAELIFAQLGIVSRLSVEDVSIILRRPTQSIRNSISKGNFPIPSYSEGRRRWFDVRHVAYYLDRLYMPVPPKKRGRPSNLEKLGRSA